MTYSRQDTLRQQQTMLREQRRILRWYQDNAPDLDYMPALLEAVGVPVLLREAQMATIKPEISEKIDAWANALRDGDFRRPNLYVEGGRKIGKSYISASVLRKMALRNKVIGWRSWNTFVQAGYDRMRTADLSGDEYAERLFAEVDERWLTQDVIQVLVIDEVDVMATQDFILQDMFTLLKHRTDYGLVTILNGRTARPGDGTINAKAFTTYRNETSLVLP